MKLSFEVLGVPAPKGSTRAINRGGKPRVVQGGSDTGKAMMEAWATAVETVARGEVLKVRRLIPDGGLDVPVRVEIEFRLPKPVSLPAWRTMAWTRPDIDKLVRCTLDALVAAKLLRDDGRVVDLVASKRFALLRPAGASVVVETLDAVERAQGEGLTAVARAKDRVASS